MCTRNPKISVIVPVYKAEKYLHRCVDSILSQTFTDFELLLVDDGSPDNSGNICDDYAKKDTRVRVFHQENKGVSRSRNCGLENAIGEYIMFIDSDDEIHVSAMDICYNTAIINDIDTLQYSLTRDYKELGKRNPTSGPVAVVDYVKSGEFMVCIGGSFIRRSVIENQKIRFNNSLKIAEDLIFILTCIACSRRCQRLFDNLYYYMNNIYSVSNNRKTIDMIKSCNALHEFKSRYPIFSGAIDAGIVRDIIAIIVNDDCEEQELYNIIRKDLPYNKSQMKFNQCFFAYLSRYSVKIAVRVVRFWHKIR